MSRLAEERCVACTPRSVEVTGEELPSLLAEIPDWSIVEVDGLERLRRRYAFGDYERALAFTEAVGALAEREGHHPAILTEWGQVTVDWWTHAIGGLHRNDFVAAAKTDELTAA